MIAYYEGDVNVVNYIQEWTEIMKVVEKQTPDYILVRWDDESSGNELDRRYEEVKEELELYQEFDNS